MEARSKHTVEREHRGQMEITWEETESSFGRTRRQERGRKVWGHPVCSLHS